jgi:hypothetical protein
MYCWKSRRDLGFGGNETFLCCRVNMQEPPVLPPVISKLKGATMSQSSESGVSVVDGQHAPGVNSAMPAFPYSVS